MKLTVKEQERLIMFNVAEVSRRRWKRGVKLNYIEAMSIICDELLERAREGRDSIYDLVELGSRIITEEDVMEGTQVMFPDGNKLVSVQEPIRLEKREDAVPVSELVSMNY